MKRQEITRKFKTILCERNTECKKHTKTIPHNYDKWGYMHHVEIARSGVECSGTGTVTSLICSGRIRSGPVQKVAIHFTYIGIH